MENFLFKTIGFTPLGLTVGAIIIIAPLLAWLIVAAADKRNSDLRNRIAASNNRKLDKNRLTLNSMFNEVFHNRQDSGHHAPSHIQQKHEEFYASYLEQSPVGSAGILKVRNPEAAVRPQEMHRRQH